MESDQGSAGQRGTYSRDYHDGYHAAMRDAGIKVDPTKSVTASDPPSSYYPDLRHVKDGNLQHYDRYGHYDGYDAFGNTQRVGRYPSTGRFRSTQHYEGGPHQGYYAERDPRSWTHPEDLRYALDSPDPVVRAELNNWFNDFVQFMHWSASERQRINSSGYRGRTNNPVIHRFAINL